jgi:hypothetical protein
MIGSCESNNEATDSVKFGKSFDWLINYWLLKNGFVLWS